MIDLCFKKRTYRNPIRDLGSGLMTYQTCIGLTREMYEDDDQINAGPGLVVPFQARTLAQVYRLIVLCVMSVSRGQLTEFLSVANKMMPSSSNRTMRKAADSSRIANSKTTERSSNKNEKQNAKSESEFEPYDKLEDFRARLRLLLAKLNMAHWESIFVSDFKNKQLEEAVNDVPPPFLMPPANAGVMDLDRMGIDLSTPQLPPLPPPPSADQKNASKNVPFYLMGPAYIIMSNDKDTNKFIEAYIYFPSMTKDAQPAPNYDFLAKSHQWLNRFLYDNIYTITGSPGCEQACFGTPNAVTSSRKGCNTHQTIYACGCRTDSDKQASCYDRKSQARKEIKKINLDGSPGSTIKGPPIYYQYTTYRINIGHRMIRNYFHKDSPRSLVLNVVPSNWNIFPGCKYSFLSRNRQFFTRFETTFLPIPGTRRGRGKRATMEYEPATRFGLHYTRKDDIPELCKKKRVPQFSRPLFIVQLPGYPKRAAVEGLMLNLYTSDDKALFGPEELAWSIQIATDDAQEPIAMVLLDNGRFDVYDKNNKSVLNPNFAKYVETGKSTFIQGAGLATMYTGAKPEDGEYDPVADYARRLEMLRNWLRVRNLLIELETKYMGTLPPAGKRAVTYEIGEFQQFDPNVDYTERYKKLLAQLAKLGFSLSSTPETRKSSKTVPHRSDETFPEYNVNSDLEKRLVELKQAIHR